MPMDTTLIAAAVFAEVKPLVRRLGLRREGPTRWVGDGVTLVLTGMGERAGRCIDEALAEERFARVFSVGVAGALRDGLAVGDLVVPERVVDATGAVHSPTVAADTNGTLLTVDALVASSDAKRALAASHAADAVDMETAHIASVCDERGVPWLSIRTISDTADRAIPPELGAMVTDAGQPDTARIVRWALARPSRMAALVRLGRDTKSAAARLADAVIERL